MAQTLHERRIVRDNADIAALVWDMIDDGTDTLLEIPVVNVAAAAGYLGLVFTWALLVEAPALVGHFFRELGSVLSIFPRTIRNNFSSTRARDDARIARRLNRELRGMDSRQGRFLPDRAYAGGINLIPGVYSITINFFNGACLIHSERHENVPVQAGALNLVTSYFF